MPPVEKCKRWGKQQIIVLSCCTSSKVYGTMWSYLQAQTHFADAKNTPTGKLIACPLACQMESGPEEGRPAVGRLLLGVAELQLVQVVQRQRVRAPCPHGLACAQACIRRQHSTKWRRWTVAYDVTRSQLSWQTSSGVLILFACAEKYMY